MKTTGRFQSNFSTNAGAWMKDRAWQTIANPTQVEREKRVDGIELKAIEKKHEQKKLQYMILE